MREIEGDSVVGHTFLYHKSQFRKQGLLKLYGLRRGQLQDEVGSNLLELDHRHSCSFELEHEMELSLGCFGVVNQPDSVEVGVADADGARQIRRADPLNGQDDSRCLVGNLEGSCTAVRQPPVSGDSKQC